MQSYYAMLAIELANERAREAEARWRARMFPEGFPHRPSIVRRALARTTAAISLGAAAATRRLDERAGEDLSQSFVGS